MTSSIFWQLEKIFCGSQRRRCFYNPVKYYSGFFSETILLFLNYIRCIHTEKWMIQLFKLAIITWAKCNHKTWAQAIHGNKAVVNVVWIVLEIFIDSFVGLCNHIFLYNKNSDFHGRVQRGLSDALTISVQIETKHFSDYSISNFEKCKNQSHKMLKSF